MVHVEILANVEVVSVTKAVLDALCPCLKVVHTIQVEDSARTEAHFQMPRIDCCTIAMDNSPTVGTS